MAYSDILLKIGDSLVQHGPLNNRIYLMKAGDSDPESLLASLNKLAQENSYTKIFAKIPEKFLDLFLADGYKTEAYIPGFYNGREYAYFMAKYSCPERAIETNKEEISDIIQVALSKKPGKTLPELEPGFEFLECQPEQAAEMAQVYARVFESYPFPIDDPEYILKTMQENVRYYGIVYQGRLVALSSAEMDAENRNAEMTDFATLPEYRKQGLALYLLLKMEKQMPNFGIKILYTIARALSYGMNITFSKAGYNFSGTLINNTNICGNFESMNVWYKTLTSP